jgi:hypothetical protein
LPVLNTNLASIAKYVAKFINDKVGQKVTLVGNSMRSYWAYFNVGSPRIGSFTCSYRSSGFMKEVLERLFLEEEIEII